MFQFLGVILILVIIKLLADNIKPSLKNNTGHKSDVIDVTGKWIDADDMPYQKNEYLLSKSELSILKTLNELLVSTRYVVFPHICLADLLQVPPQTLNRQEYLFRIKERSVDMVIFEAAYLKPVLVINLVDSDPGSKRPGVDQFTKAAIQTAGINTLSIDLGNTPARSDLERLIRDRGLTL